MLDKWMKSENAGRECPCYQLVFSKVTHGSPHPQSLRMWLCLETGTLKRIVRFSSVTQLCPNLCNHEAQHTRPPCQSPTPRVHDDAIQPSHPLLFPSPPALNLSHHQGLLHWLGCNDFCIDTLHQVTKYWSISISPSNEYTGEISFKIDALISLQSKRVSYSGLSRLLFNTTVQKHQFFGTQISLCSTLTFICGKYE